MFAQCGFGGQRPVPGRQRPQRSLGTASSADEHSSKRIGGGGGGNGGGGGSSGGSGGGGSRHGGGKNGGKTLAPSGAAETKLAAPSWPREFYVRVQPNCSHPGVDETPEGADNDGDGDGDTAADESAGRGVAERAGKGLRAATAARRSSPTRVHVRLQSPPVDGKANKELVEALADHFKVPKAAVVIVRGHTAKDKTVRIAP